MALGPRSRRMLRAMEAWLRADYPVKFPVSVRLVAKVPADPDDTPRARRYGYYGDTYAKGRAMVIRISTSRNRTLHQALDTFMHEWAHLRARPERIKRPHGPLWRNQFGAIYEHFIDRRGWEKALRYYQGPA